MVAFLRFGGMVGLVDWSGMGMDGWMDGWMDG